MKTGNLQRRFSESEPTVYDKSTRIVCLDIKEDTQTDEDGNEIQGYSYIPVEIDRQIDYGHIKSQLIEAGFAQKDEFGLLMNAVDNLVTAIGTSDSYSNLKTAVSTEDIQAFKDFCEFRVMCADAAKKVMESYM